MQRTLNNGYTHFEFEPAWPLENDDGKQALPFCEIHEVNGVEGKRIVIVTAAHNHEGEHLNRNLSITNGIEKIATRLLNLGVKWTHFVEHYPENGEAREYRLRTGKTLPETIGSETIDLVTFSHDLDFNRKPRCYRPQWKHIGRAKLQKLMGKPFPDYYDKDAWNAL